MGDTNASPTVRRARAIVAELAASSAEGHAPVDVTEPAIALAGLLMAEALRCRSDAEAKQTEMLAALMCDASGQVFTTLLTDRAFRTSSPERLQRELTHLVNKLGVPRYLKPIDRALLAVGARAGRVVPRLVQRGLLTRLRGQTRSVILPARDPSLHAHLARRSDAGVAVNVNHLGEAVLSEAEAMERVDHYRALLARSDVRTISVKVSSICSQLNLLAWDATLERLVPRLRSIYAAAIEHGGAQPKLVYLDMEAYRDLHLTLAVFGRVLAEPEFQSLTAGVVLQAYLPDSFPLQQEITRWAIERVNHGGAPIRLRVVKGANLAAESVEASLRGWPSPVYASKHETDANYKRMVDYGCRADHAHAVNLGIASHNAFDLAFGVASTATHGTQRSVEFELLEGMADPMLRALNSIAGNVLVYAPIVDDHEIQSAIAYLIRRLDENTAPDNFLRHSFSLRTNTTEWVDQERRFRDALQARDGVSTTPLRTQDRSKPPEATAVDAAFTNEPDTDFGAAHSRQWIARAVARWHDLEIEDVVSHVGGVDCPGAMNDGFDPSRHGVVPYRYATANEQTVEQALVTACLAGPRWNESTIGQRDQLLHAVAARLREERGNLIGAMLLDAGKSVVEADVEVSETIDFAEYYRRSARELLEREDIECAPKGVVLVTPPWNFPLAIAAGGVLAAIATGNAVILKPAAETVLVARRLCEALWAAGVGRDLLQLLICEDALGSKLIEDARVNLVVLTGATDTARLFRRLRPGLDLIAETGGKNAVAVSAMSDWDLAIKDVLHSAFGHAGQKCSAASLLICEAEVYDSESFQRRLRDAAASMIVGSAWNLDSNITPLIHSPRGALERGLTQLDADERWLITPRCDETNPRLWSPGIRTNVAEQSFCHRTELFGPMLSVMRATDLDHAIDLANGTVYGLTSGLFSLDEHEQQHWMRRIDAGNLYINRGITGAIVRRQPFGGTKASSFGPGAKAGGPGYVAQFVNITSKRERDNYLATWTNYFSARHDPSSVLGQDNVFDHVPCKDLCVLVTSDAMLVDVERVMAALEVTGVIAEFATVDATPECLAAIRNRRRHIHTDHHARDLLQHVAARGFQRIRVIGTAPIDLIAASHTIDAHIERAPVSTSGRVELSRYLRERSTSTNYHRYGNLSRITD